jgi:orotate phosphoribosyltransferase
MKLRQELLRLLGEKAYLHQLDQPFQLASGKTSDYYINCKLATLSSRGARLVGQFFFEQLRALHLDAVGGVETGACPIVDAIVYTSELKRRPLTGFYIRKEQKAHGTKLLVEGDLRPSERARVVIVDDVVTSGGSILKGIERLRSFATGVEIVKVIALVDREEGGAENIRQAGFEFSALFTKTELRQAHMESRHGHPASESDRPEVSL